MVWTMVEDMDGMIWFSQQGQNPIWRFEPDKKVFEGFKASASPFQMKMDSTGTIWFTTLTANTIGTIQETSSHEYMIKEFHLGFDGLPSGIFFEDHNVWITMIKNGKVVKYQPIKNEEGKVIDLIKIIEIPEKDNIIYSPTDVFIQNNTSIWITEHGTSFISKFTKDRFDVIKFPTSKNPHLATTLPFWIRGDLGGNGFWFNEHTGNKIGFFDTTKMELIEYDIPSRPSDGHLVYPLGIATDPTNDNLLWFSEWNTDKFGVVDRGIPLPFDIILNETSIHHEPDMCTIEMEINLLKNMNVFFENPKSYLVFLNASSTLELNGGLGNMTVSFSKNFVNLNEKNIEIVNVLIQNLPNEENHIISISGTNGEIIKSIFFELNENETNCKSKMLTTILPRI
jgi:virginiamycin B lyase